MSVIGIIAEYNPFHSGHAYHIRQAREALGGDASVLCVMSGNWVQRGDAAIADKWQRAAMALRGGADLVLELPTPWATASAEGFARGAVQILKGSGIVNVLSFGSESGDAAPLRAVAECLDTEDYRAALQAHLQKGLSFPVARQRAATALLGAEAACLQSPNNNLGIEYLRALRALDCEMEVLTVCRRGGAHDSEIPEGGHASASYLRKTLLSGETSLSLLPYLSAEDGEALAAAEFSSLSFAERAVFARLRAMSAEDFLTLPDCGEGLHHLLARAALESESLEALYDGVKSKRYTHARIRRLVLYAFLGLHAADRPEAPPYLRVLGMNARGKALLAKMRKRATLPILTKPSHSKRLDAEAQALFALEARCTALYALCRTDFGSGSNKNEFNSNPVIL